MKSAIREKIEVDSLVGEIVEKYGPEKIILFGSRAKGQADEYSDLDLIIVKETDKRFVERLVDPILLEILPARTDIFIYTPAEFEQMKAQENPFIMKALESAKTLYEKL